MCDVTHSYVNHLQDMNIWNEAVSWIALLSVFCTSIAIMFATPDVDALISRCVALRYTVLRCVVLCYSLFRCSGMCCTLLRCVSLCCTVLHCVALCLSLHA